MDISVSSALQERRWRKMRRKRGASVEENLAAFLAFAPNVQIRVPGRGKIPFEPFPAQIEFVRLCLEERYALALKSRQIGYSTVIAIFTLWSALSIADYRIVKFSKGEREAIKLLLKSKVAYKSLPTWIKERAPAIVDNNQTKMSFSNEAEIESLPSGNEPARGDSVDLAVLDEWAFMPNPEAAWASVEPIADVGGAIVAISTANGSGNLFHQMWVDSQLGENDFKGLFFPWSAREGRDQNWYEATKRKHKATPEKFYQEYPTTPEEAFLKSGRNVFDVDRLMDMVTRPPLKRQRIHVLGSGLTADFRPDEFGELLIWEEAQPGVGYVIGADVAEGLEHGDASCAYVARVDTGDIVAAWHGRPDPDVFGCEILYHIGRRYNWALVGPENNNHGISTCKALQRMSYRRIFKQRRVGGRREKAVDSYGWKTTAQSKRLVIDELHAWMRDHDMPDARGVEEAKSYVRDDHARMGGSPYDDRVMAWAITVKMVEYAFKPEFAQEKDADEGTFAHMERYLDKLDAAEKRRSKVLGGQKRRRPSERSRKRLARLGA